MSPPATSFNLQAGIAYDPQNNLIETDVTSFTLTASGVLSFASATAQGAIGSLKVTAP